MFSFNDNLLLAIYSINICENITLYMFIYELRNKNHTKTWEEKEKGRLKMEMQSSVREKLQWRTQSLICIYRKMKIQRKSNTKPPASLIYREKRLQDIRSNRTDWRSYVSTSSKSDSARSELRAPQIQIDYRLSAGRRISCPTIVVAADYWNRDRFSYLARRTPSPTSVSAADCSKHDSFRS